MPRVYRRARRGQARADSSGSVARGRRPATPSSASCQKPTRSSPESPAQPDLPSAHQGRKVDEPGGDVPQDDPALVEPCDIGLHLVHEAAHPEAQAAELRIVASGIALCDGILGHQILDQGALTIAVGIPQPNELGTLVAEPRGNHREVGDQRIGIIGREQAGHAAIVPMGPAPVANRSRVGPIGR